MHGPTNTVSAHRKANRLLREPRSLCVGRTGSRERTNASDRAPVNRKRPLQRRHTTFGLSPVSLTRKTITRPDGRRFDLYGGTASPLSWLPMPVMGCALNDDSSTWPCGAGFYREGFTPIVAGNTRYSNDSLVLARALGLARVAIANRKGADPKMILAKVQALSDGKYAIGPRYGR